jgi:hypothetical protein
LLRDLGVAQFVNVAKNQDVGRVRAESGYGFVQPPVDVFGRFG